MRPIIPNYTMAIVKSLSFNIITEKRNKEKEGIGRSTKPNV